MRLSLALKDASDAEGVCIAMISGDVTGVAAAADLGSIVNLDARPLCVRASAIRWATKTAFASAQCLEFRVNKVYGFTANNNSGGTSVQAHHYFAGGIVGNATGGRIALTSISGYIAATGAISGGTYTAEDLDEPEQIAVSAGATLPGIYDDYIPVGGLPWVLEQNTGLVLNNHIAMGGSGVGHLFWRVDAYRLG